MRIFMVVVCLGCISGCGDSVLVQGSGGDDPPTVTTGTSTGSTGSGTTGTNTRDCGVGQPPCPPDSWCDTDPSCGVGTCAPKPTGCDDDCPGVCGCDGQDYCNACLAQQAGVDSTPGSCGSAEYAAAAWPGGLDHIIIMRADSVQNSCIRVFVDAPTMGSFSVTAPSPWGVSQITAWSSATDCLDWQVQPPGVAVSAATATGGVSWQLGPNMFYPCDLDVAITLTFDDVPPWSSGQETLAEQAITVEGGCF